MTKSSKTDSILCKDVTGVINERIVLSPEDIYEKEFKIDARGYRPEEVDNFLDLVIKDYGEFIKIIRAYEKEYQSVARENRELKNKLRLLEQEAKDGNGSHASVSNVDLLRRISQLEKIVYNKNNDWTNAA